MGRLAIKGHSNRSAEVISILEMYGGYNYHGALCDNPRLIYFVDDKFRIQSDISRKVNYDEFTILTVEEYNKKFPCRVGEYINIKLGDNKYCSDEVVKIIWGSKEEGPFYVTKQGYARTVEGFDYIVPYVEYNKSNSERGEESSPGMSLYKVTIKTYHFGTKIYELFVLADSIDSMRRTVYDKIYRDDDAEILTYEVINMNDTKCRVL